MTAARYLLVLMLCWLAAAAQAQQVGDTLFVPVLGPPTYKQETGPRVLIDAAHHNFHTATGRYRPFADVLHRDGYVVTSNDQKFTPETLANADVLVIANALNERNLGNWTLPSYAAFTPDEVEAVYQWVENGGALFLIADHMPFPGAANELAGAFGFRLLDGFAIDTTATCIQCPLPFRAANGALRPHTITQDIDSVATFTGQAFLATVEDVEPLLVLGPGAESLLPQQAWQFDDATPHLSSGGWLQGAVRKVGAGRIAVFGEAAMFTAQRAGPNGDILIGMNAPEASQNARFLQQVMRWLAADEE
ncbi:MAG TPA: DUF4350 domain-containing protein [Rhodothermales bacterium]|nr:DUF4350 domain-containing protein [Rhodothermales bacterium]